MPRESTIIAAGVWILILPFLGFPESARIVLFVLTGAGLIALGFRMRVDALARGGEENENRLFVENAHARKIADMRPQEHEREEIVRVN